MSTAAPKAIVNQIPADAQVAIVASRFNPEIVEKLLEGCRGQLSALGAKNVQLHRVPGAFELPLAAKLLAQTGNFAAVICLGAVVRGDTPHFDYVAGECARGIAQAALQTGVPVIFGVLTTNTQEQARERIGGSHGHAGVSAAEAAAEMIQFVRNVQSTPSGPAASKSPH